MLATDEAAFLQSIADRPDDDAPRLVFADWLDERGESGRAEFIRVQCELASSKLDKKRRHELRLRERDLLNEHRQNWIEAIELPVEDVVFERGLIARARVPNWDGGKLLDAPYSTRLATLIELDLSGLQMGNPGVIAFAKSADFAALRKLILSNNAITNVGAIQLAAATGLPKLDTLYLFGNQIGNPTGGALPLISAFKLKTLDVGERKDGYCMSAGEAEMGRRQYIRERLLPVVSKYFEKYKRLQSAMLCVAQYWADEADDAVHGQVIVSELFEPTLDGVSYDSGRDKNIPNTNIKSQYSEKPSSAVSLWEANAYWDDNNGAIPLWAAYAPEEGSQEYEYIKDVYRPAVMFYRHGGYEFLPMARPHLNGIQSQWSAEGFGDD